MCKGDVYRVSVGDAEFIWFCGRRCLNMESKFVPTNVSSWDLSHVALLLFLLSTLPIRLCAKVYDYNRYTVCAMKRQAGTFYTDTDGTGAGYRSVGWDQGGGRLGLLFEVSPLLSVVGCYGVPG